MNQKYTTLTIALCILSSAVVIDAFSEQIKAFKRFRDRSKKCVRETGATQADVDDLLDLKEASGTVAECFRACLSKQYGVLTMNGKLNRQGTLDMFKKLWPHDKDVLEKANLVIDECIKLKLPKNTCHVVTIVNNCLKEQAIIQGILVAEHHFI